MNVCPHCGEPLDDYATACPHCGSDWETGWSPDADLYGFELPEDDAVEPERSFAAHPSATNLEGFVWGACVAVAAVIFIWTTYAIFTVPVTLAATAVLGASFLLFHRSLRRGIRFDA